MEPDTEHRRVPGAMGDHVRACEVHGLQAALIDGVCGGDHVDLTVVDEGLALRGRGFTPFDFWRGPAVLLCDVFHHVAGNVGIQAGELLVWGALPQVRLVVLGAHYDVAGFDIRQQVAGTARAARGQRHHACGGDHCSGEALECAFESRHV